VLDALLDQPGLAFEGISGSSAGAMNAVVFTHGWMLGRADGARQALADFWAEVGRQIDFAQLRSSSPFKLFIGGTQANTGKLRIFRETELTVEMLLASACLPKIHHPVEIDSEPYWDGGYSANPAVFPLFYDCLSRDVLLVLLNPLQHAETPHTVQAIETRIAELGFSAQFMREMRMFAQATAFA
jgi:NTE family protein